MKKSLFQILDNEDSYLDVENISSKLKDCIIKSNWSDCFIIWFASILLWITIDVFASYASLYNLTIYNSLIFNFLYIL